MQSTFTSTRMMAIRQGSVRHAPAMRAQPALRKRSTLIARAEEDEKSKAVEAEVVEDVPSSEAKSPLEALKAIDGSTEYKEQLAALEAELAELRARADGAETTSAAAMTQFTSIKDQYLRLQADFDNYRRRSQTERDSLSTAAKEDVVKLFLPLIDGFDLARQQVKPSNEGEEKINNSYQGMYRQMVDVFRKLGVEAVETVGKPFDPNVHEAIMREDNLDVEDETVLEEFRKGFTISGRLIRPSMVKVSSGGPPRPPVEAKEEEATA